MSQRSPGIQEALNTHFEYSTSGMYTAIPGIVVSVEDLAEQKINVQPTINLRSADGIEVNQRPPILSVPLHMPLTKQGGLSYPISVGTPVFLMFSMRGLDIWKRSNGYPSTPSDVRQFDIRDCVAIPGIYPFSEAPNSPSKRINEHSVDDVVLVHNIGSNEVEIRLRADGSVKVTSPVKVEIVSPETEINSDDVTINSSNFSVNTATYSMIATDSATQVGTISHNGSFVLNGTEVENHTHKGIEPGSGTTSPFGA